jgi:hypothetical protein
MIRKLRANKNGILLVGIICIVFIVLSSIIWLVGALILNRVFDAFGPWFAITDPRTLAVSQSALNAYGISTIITDIAFISYWAISTQRQESEEYPAGMYY